MPNVTTKTLKYYYKSPKHILFMLSLIAMTSVGNYYNYYVSINEPD